ncbi:MAG: urea transporter [Hafnia sp.]
MKISNSFTLKEVADSLFRGFSQIILQSNTVAGIFFFAAIVIAGIESQKPELIFYTITGAILSPMMAYAMNYSEEEIKNGIWGYNAILYSIALSIFTPTSTQSIFLLILGNIGVVVLTPLLARYLGSLPVLTLPFVMMTWLACLLADIPDETSSVQTSKLFIQPVDYITASINNYMEIFLLSSFTGGILVILGLTFCDKKILFITSIVSVISVTLSQVDDSVTLNKVINGLYGYNVILTTVAVILFGKLEFKANIITGAWCVGFTLVSGIVLNTVLSQWSLPMLTLPFVICTWLYLSVQKSLEHV